MNPSRLNRNRFIATLVALILLALLAGAVNNAKWASETTKVRLVSSDKSAVLSVSAPGYHAQVVGTGNADIRLKPGNYLIGASDKGSHSTALVKVVSGVNSFSVDPSTTQAKLPSVDSINFSGDETLLNQGLSSEQVDILKLYLFKFDTGAQKINLTNIVPGAHNPDKDVGFKTDLKINVDGKDYAGAISYTNVDNLRLQLTDSSGRVVFDSQSESE